MLLTEKGITIRQSSQHKFTVNVARNIKKHREEGGESNSHSKPITLGVSKRDRFKSRPESKPCIRCNDCL